MIEKNSGKPYMNVIFGNFYSPGYDDPDFVDETMELIKNLGYNSVMFDTKDWEDFRERYKTGERSQYVPAYPFQSTCIWGRGRDNRSKRWKMVQVLVRYCERNDGRACRPDPSNVRGGLYHLPVGTKTGPSNMYGVGSDCSAKF